MQCWCNEWEQTSLQLIFAIVKTIVKINIVIFHVSILLLTKNFTITLSKYWSLQIHLAIASRIHSYFDNVMMTFMINNMADAWKNWCQFVNYNIKSSAAVMRAHFHGYNKNYHCSKIVEDILALQVFWADWSLSYMW